MKVSVLGDDTDETAIDDVKDLREKDDTMKVTGHHAEQNLNYESVENHA